MIDGIAFDFQVVSIDQQLQIPFQYSNFFYASSFFQHFSRPSVRFEIQQ